MTESHSPAAAGHYDANYGNFETKLYAQIRHEAFGEDIGQNSWLTTDEQDSFLEWLDLRAGKNLLDIACGAGGPTLRVAANTGCSVVGLDIHQQAITTARSLAAQRGFPDRADFHCVDATAHLPFSDGSFDAISCIDAINHFPCRPGILAEWIRVLKAGGRLLFTDPTTLTGPLTNAEVAARSAAGFYVFVPYGYDERIIAECGLRLLVCKNLTSNMANIAEARRAARESKSVALHEIEGDRAYENQQEFLSVAARVAREGRLSRFLYVAEK
jgi:SAM-dependent methyltransferase